MDTLVEFLGERPKFDAYEELVAANLQGRRVIAMANNDISVGGRRDMVSCDLSRRRKLVTITPNDLAELKPEKLTVEVEHTRNGSLQRKVLVLCDCRSS